MEKAILSNEWRSKINKWLIPEGIKEGLSTLGDRPLNEAPYFCLLFEQPSPRLKKVWEDIDCTIENSDQMRALIWHLWSLCGIKNVVISPRNETIFKEISIKSKELARLLNRHINIEIWDMSIQLHHSNPKVYDENYISKLRDQLLALSAFTKALKLTFVKLNYPKKLKGKSNPTWQVFLRGMATIVFSIIGETKNEWVAAIAEQLFNKPTTKANVSSHNPPEIKRKRR